MNACTPKRGVLRELTNEPQPPHSPHPPLNNLSPTANLKLLTNVALTSHQQRNSLAAVTHQRKDKSLQILCDRFLELYPLYGTPAQQEIHLDATAQRLGVEKRRIYDIINILEALQCCLHRGKNTYSWRGGAELARFLASLPSRRKRTQTPKRRSLGDLAQRFLAMFLAEPPGALVNLDMAVSALIVHKDSDAQLKSKVRRLYDIANVLTSVGLIERVPASALKKPVFRYVGVPSAVMTPESPRSVRPDPVRSKRKLVFSPLPSPKTRKWDDIMHVVHMELDRINRND